MRVFLVPYPFLFFSFLSFFFLFFFFLLQFIAVFYSGRTFNFLFGRFFGDFSFLRVNSLVAVVNTFSL